jgi:hypothetical protein
MEVERNRVPVWRGQESNRKSKTPVRPCIFCKTITAWMIDLRLPIPYYNNYNGG